MLVRVINDGGPAASDLEDSETHRLGIASDEVGLLTSFLIVGFVRPLEMVVAHVKDNFAKPPPQGWPPAPVVF